VGKLRQTRRAMRQSQHVVEDIKGTPDRVECAVCKETFKRGDRTIPKCEPKGEV